MAAVYRCGPGLQLRGRAPRGEGSASGGIGSDCFPNASGKPNGAAHAAAGIRLSSPFAERRILRLGARPASLEATRYPGRTEGAERPSGAHHLAAAVVRWLRIRL